MTLRQGKSRLGTYAVMLASQLGHAIAVVEEDEIVNRLLANELNFVIQDELAFPKPYNSGRNKSKGEKKRQRSEWNRSIYNSRKGLQRG